MTKPSELAGYLAEAASWDADRAAQNRRSARVAWGTAGAGWLAAILAIGAVMLLTPLKSVEPFVIRIDNSTGIVDVVPVYKGNAELSEVFTRHLLTTYIRTCERYFAFVAESDYMECGAFHSDQRNRVWEADWKRTNPKSPLNLYRDGTSVRVEVNSLTFFKRGNGVSDLAQVRYIKAKRPPGGVEEHVTHWVAFIQYAYGDPPKDERVRSRNPIGFRVIDFKSEQEVLPETRSTSSAGLTTEGGLR